MGRSRLFVAAVAGFVLGLGFMLPFEYTITRLLGVISLATFVVCGLLLIANADFLAGDDDGD